MSGPFPSEGALAAIYLPCEVCGIGVDADELPTNQVPVCDDCLAEASDSNCWRCNMAIAVPEPLWEEVEHVCSGCVT